MAYNITKSNGTAITIADGAVDYSQLSIGLVGKNTIGYGDEIAQNFVQMLENFANTSQPANPTVGQLYFDTTGAEGSLRVHTNTGFKELVIAGNIQGDLIPDTDLAYNIGSPSYRWNTIYGTATSAQYADLAERYEADKPLEPGTVVVIGGAKEVQASIQAAQYDVFGVVSTAPGLMLNSDAGEDSTHPYIALAGRVPVKVHGTCKKGDRLMASDHDGEAMVAPEDADYKSIIGRALEDKDTRECSLIEAVVGAK